MNIATHREILSASSHTMTLEQHLLCFCAFGAPRITKMGGGWYCVVEMHVAAKGATFSVGSEMNKSTPIEAARECAERVIETLKIYG